MKDSFSPASGFWNFKEPVLDQKLCAIEGFQRVHLYRFLNHFLNTKSVTKTGKISVTKSSQEWHVLESKFKKHMNSICITYMMQ